MTCPAPCPQASSLRRRPTAEQLDGSAHALGVKPPPSEPFLTPRAVPPSGPTGDCREQGVGVAELHALCDGASCLCSRFTVMTIEPETSAMSRSRGDEAGCRGPPSPRARSPRRRLRIRPEGLCPLARRARPGTGFGVTSRDFIIRRRLVPAGSGAGGRGPRWSGGCAQRANGLSRPVRVHSGDRSGEAAFAHVHVLHGFVSRRSTRRSDAEVAETRASGRWWREGARPVCAFPRAPKVPQALSRFGDPPSRTCCGDVGCSRSPRDPSGSGAGT